MNNGLAHPANIGGENYFVWASDYAGYSAHCSTSIVPRDESVSVTSGPVPARQSAPPPLAGPPRSAGGWRRMIAFARGASTEIRNYRRNSAHLQSGRRRSAPDNACRQLVNVLFQPAAACQAARTSSASPGEFPFGSCIPKFLVAAALNIALRNTLRLHWSTCSLIHRADIAHHEIREKVVLRRGEHCSGDVRQHGRPQRTGPQAHIFAGLIPRQLPHTFYFAQCEAHQSQKEN